MSFVNCWDVIWHMKKKGRWEGEEGMDEGREGAREEEREGGKEGGVLPPVTVISSQ